MTASADHLSTAAAAALLGISQSKVRDLVRTDQLASVVVAGCIRISRAAVDERLAGTTPGPAPADVSMVERILGVPIESLPLLLDPDWLAEHLGMSAKSVRRAMSSGDIPSVVVGSRRRCPTVALIKWLSSGGRAA